jgi:plastocyanin
LYRIAERIRDGNGAHRRHGPAARRASAGLRERTGATAAVAGGLPAEPVVIDQRGCEYLPRVAGLRAGQRVAFRNDDQALHNVHALGTGSNAFNFGMPVTGMRTERLLTEPQVMVTVACDVHPWMRAYLGVVQHPFFAVTSADGR